MILDREPLITVGTITAVISALLVFLQSMGVNIDDETQAAIRNLVAVLAPIVLALIARQFVYSPASVARIADQQYTAGVPPTQPQPDVPPPA